MAEPRAEIIKNNTIALNMRLLTKHLYLAYPLFNPFMLINNNYLFARHSSAPGAQAHLDNDKRAVAFSNFCTMPAMQRGNNIFFNGA